MMQINYGYLKKLNLLKYIGTKVSGVVNDKSSKKIVKKNVEFEVTLRGLLVVTRREGVGIVRDYLKLLEGNANNYYLPRNQISPNNLSHYNNIEERLFHYE